MTEATLTVLQLKLCINIAFTCYFLKIILKFLHLKNFLIMSVESSTVCGVTGFSRKEVPWQLSVQKFQWEVTLFQGFPDGTSVKRAHVPMQET